MQIIGVCNHDPETTVLAHLPSEVKGVATKSDDFNAVFACSECHLALDQHKIDREAWELFYSLRALQRTLKIWVEMGLISVAGVNDRKPKRSTKSLPPRSFSAKDYAP